jgi:hypothetical protein
LSKSFQSQPSKKNYFQKFSDPLKIENTTLADIERQESEIKMIEKLNICNGLQG